MSTRRKGGALGYSGQSPGLAHEIEERGARHFGLHLEGGLKLRVALGDGERCGGHIGVLLLAQFGLELDVVVGAVVGGVGDPVLHGAVEGLGGIEMIRGELQGSTGRRDLRRVVGQQAETQVVERGEDIAAGQGVVGIAGIEDILGALGDGERSAGGA